MANLDIRDGQGFHGADLVEPTPRPRDDMVNVILGCLLWGYILAVMALGLGFAFWMLTKLVGWLG